MDYPEDFPDECKPNVDLAITHAESAMSKAKRAGKSIDICIRDYVKTVHVAYCFAINDAVYLEYWKPERARKEMQRHLKKLLTDVTYEQKGSVSGTELDIGVRALRNEIEWKSNDWEEIQGGLRNAIEKVEEKKRDIVLQEQQEYMAQSKGTVVSLNLKAYRAETKWSQQELADEAEINIRNLQRHESGDTPNIRVKNLQAYERVLSRKLGRTIKLKEPYSP